MDMKNVLLNGVLQDDVYVRQPPGFKNAKYPDRVYKLLNASCGLKQSPQV
jgi:hypothetical protein